MGYYKKTVQDTPETEKTETMGFSWHTDRDKHSYVQGIELAENPKDSYAFVIFHQPFPNIPKDLISGFQKYTNKKGDRVLYAGFGNFPLEEKSAKDTDFKHSLTREKEKERVGKKPNPKTITLEMVAKILLEGKKVIIYTGAGISVASGTPNMKQLEKKLGINRPKELFDSFTRDLLLNPQTVRAKLAELSKVFYYGSTPAHIAITELQKRFGLTVTTENLDRLHQHAKTKVVDRNGIDKKIPNSVLKQTDYILTVGLKSDDSGLLYRFRQVNPNGKFIALNLEVPTYLDDKDYYLEGDVQNTVPKIEELAR